MRKVLIRILLSGLVVASVALVGTPLASAQALWTIQTSPNPAGTNDAALFAVSCVPGGACEAVGEFIGADGGFQPLAEGSADGTNWTLQPTPSRALNSYLTGVSCVNASWCMAVGTSISRQAVQHALAEVWNGSSWTILSTPAPTSHSGRVGLVDVSCTSENVCIAVGGYGAAPLAERWNGSAWSILTSVPNPHAENGSELSAVSCVRDVVCEAGANYDFADIDQSVYALGYKKGEWTTQEQPNFGGDDTDSGMSCTSKADCVSVGSFTHGENNALVETYDGSTWSGQDAPAPGGAASSELIGVSCDTPTACSAVGDWNSTSDPSVQQPLAETYDGAVWTVSVTPAPVGAVSTTLAGVSCLPAGGCTAVGNDYNGSVTQTLIETSPG